MTVICPLSDAVKDIDLMKFRDCPAELGEIVVSLLISKDNLKSLLFVQDLLHSDPFHNMPEYLYRPRLVA